MDSSHAPSTKPLYRGTQIVWYILGIIEVLLAFRVTLKLLSANPGAWFTDVIYDASYVFVAPFQNVLQITQVAGSVFEWTTVLAMVVYFVIALAVIKLLRMGKTISTSEAAAKLQ